MPINPTGSNATVSVLLNTQSFHKGLNITGEIWLDLDGFAFPAEHWTDFPVVILSWWMDALIPLRLAQSVPAECLFMDGPYSFELSRRDANYFLHCYHDPHGEKDCLWQGSLDLNNLLLQLESAASNIVAECCRHGWVTAETTLLESKRAALTRLLESHSA